MIILGVTALIAAILSFFAVKVMKIYQIGAEEEYEDEIATVKPQNATVQPVTESNTNMDTSGVISASNGQILAQKLEWDTPQKAFHSVRMLCDEMGVSYPVKDEICYTIWGESQFNIKAIGKPNKNGTRDYGICQFNNGTNAKGIPLWIGKGAAFKDVDEVLNNPEKCVRVMIQTVKAGHIGWWYGHKGYTQPVPPTHPMWKLKV